MASVISEQHDFNQIKIDMSAVDSAIAAAVPGVWDAAEMGLTREQVQERIRAADTPEKRAEIMVDLRRRALGRADLAATDSGKICFAGVGNSHWHGLGVSVNKAMTSVEALKLASLDRQYVKIPVMYKHAGQLHDIAGVYGIGIEDGHNIRAFSNVAVGEDYVLVQPKECFAFLDDVLGSTGAHYDTAGAIDGGRKIWLSATMPEVLEPVLGDVTRNYIVLTNAYDATESLWCFSTSHRIVCANTRRQAFNKKDKGIRIRHSGKIKDRIEDAQRALGLIRRDFAKFAELAEAMVRQRAKPDYFINVVLDSCLDVGAITLEDLKKGAGYLAEQLDLSPEATAEARKRIERLIARREKVFTTMMNHYESETNLAPGTLWSAVQAVTQYANHDLRYIGLPNKKLETRFQSVLTGRADVLNQAAFSAAMEIVA